MRLSPCRNGLVMLVLGGFCAWMAFAQQAPVVQQPAPETVPGNHPPSADSGPDLGNAAQLPLAHRDHQFYDNVAEQSTNEVVLSQLAAGHSSNQDIKAFAEAIITDHTKLNTTLTGLASAQGVDVSRSVQNGQQVDVDNLRTNNGLDFDRAYLRAIIGLQKDEVSGFEREAVATQDGSLGTFTIRYIPMILQHLRRAKDLYRVINHGTSAP